MQRTGKQKLGASLLASGVLTIVGGFLLDDPATATPAGTAQASGSGSSSSSASATSTTTSTSSTTTSTTTPQNDSTTTTSSTSTTATTDTTQPTSTTTTVVISSSSDDLGVGAGGATRPGDAGVAAQPVGDALPRTGPDGIDPGILLVLGGGLAVSGILIVRYAAERP